MLYKFSTTRQNNVKEGTEDDTQKHGIWYPNPLSKIKLKKDVVFTHKLHNLYIIN
jgi:hypothetical protein